MTDQHPLDSPEDQPSEDRTVETPTVETPGVDPSPVENPTAENPVAESPAGQDRADPGPVAGDEAWRQESPADHPSSGGGVAGDRPVDSGSADPPPRGTESAVEHAPSTSTEEPAGQAPRESEARGEAEEASPNATEAQQGGAQRPRASSRGGEGDDSRGEDSRPRGRRGRGRRRRGRGRRPEEEEDVFEDDENREPGEVLGMLEVLSSGSGFIRRADAGYIPSKNDIYVGSRVIHKFGLRTGDELAGVVGRRPRNGKSPPLRHLDLVNGLSPDEARKRPEFGRLSATHPTEQLKLECDRMVAGQPDMTNRVIDLFCPLGKGQRAMIVAPAKAGKTTILQAVAEGIVTNHPECELMILLVDERPEEVTEMEAHGFGEIIASTFDLTAERHCQVAEMTLERARRRVEAGKDVVIILDSITRLARAHNTVEEGSGRTLSGGLDASSLEKPKRFLGSARLIKEDQGGGSLTIIATALVDTGSRMDQVIFEEFKGTGNSELVLSRELADRRIFPAIDLNASATRKEELLLSEAALTLSHAMRRQLSGSGPAEGMEELLRVMRQTKKNEELIMRAMERL